MKRNDYYEFERFNIGQVWNWVDAGKTRIYRPTHTIDIHLKRLAVFRTHGTKCIACRRKARFFRSEIKERDHGLIKWYFNPLDNRPPITHLNLYGANGKLKTPFLMTVDHLLPISQGGTNDMDNLAPMCVSCNEKKGNDSDWHIDLPRDKNGTLISRPERQKIVNPHLPRVKRMKWNA